MEQLESIISFAKDKDLWWIDVFIVVVLTLVIARTVSKLFNKLQLQAQKTKSIWDDAFIGAAQKPAKIAIYLIGLTLAVSLLGEHTETSILSVVPEIRRLGFIVLVSWMLIRFIKRIENNYVDPNILTEPVDETTARAVGKLLRASVFITTALVLLQSMGYSISGVLAFGGIGGVAVGFAAKDLLANFFGGVMIYLDRPFAVGDWIRSPDQEIEGTVESIGWRLTRIRTFDKRPLYIPNATFTQISVENPSRMSHRRINETFGIRYEDAGKMANIIELVKAYLNSNEDIDQSQTMIINFNKCSSSSLDFFIYVFTKTTNWVEYHEIKQRVMLDILSIIEGQGAECAFPTSTVHIPDTVELMTQKDAK